MTYNEREREGCEESRVLEQFYRRLLLDEEKALSQHNTRLSNLNSSDLEVYQLIYEYLDTPISCQDLYTCLLRDRRLSQVLHKI